MPEIKTKEEFKAFVEATEAREGYRRPEAFAIGLQRYSRKSAETLDMWFPHPNYKQNYGTAAVLDSVLRKQLGPSEKIFDLTDNSLEEIAEHFQPFKDEAGHPNIRVLSEVRRLCSAENPLNKVTGVLPVVVIIDDLSAPPTWIGDVYLRLHLLSHRLVKPNEMNLDGIFKLLPNLAWTSEGPIAISELEDRRIEAWASGRQLTVFSVDKFPRMVDYVVPSGVRIADADRVRLGAYLGEGTTVMHEGFVNFNAGTEGPDNMVEGRISAGVFVGAASDLGGSASTMGTLSGGGKERVSIGAQCLLGANSGVGIALGDRCTVEAGLYVTAGMQVIDLRIPGRPRWIRAKALSGASDLLFRRNSRTGKVEVHTNTKPNKPNAVLHTKQ